ncbi:MAG: CTP synthase [Candidatus Nealsonbacteria bacterium]|nr:CTP synthase [Candidatus Nealsonbacteria bacterium]
MSRFIFVVGGVMSGIGKGIATASIGRILKSKGFKVTAIKIDPYVNVDAGTMNPIEHGEVFVMEDGTECDQDIGNYERFLGETLSSTNYITTGRVYQAVIERERNLEYGGRCVEVVPDIPNEVISRIKKAALENEADFTLIEVGGTVGEYQNLLFLEAGRMMKLSHPDQVIFILVSYLPVPQTIGEMKTKPTQNASRTLNEAGIQPSLILGRSSLPLDEPRKRKISVFCNVNKKDVISAPNVNCVYEIPVNFEREDLGNRVLEKFGLKPKKKDLSDWKKLVENIRKEKEPVKIGIVGKYFKTGEFTLMDSYISVIEAIKHAAWSLGREPEIRWLSAEDYEKSSKSLEELKDYDGVIVPGGFGHRGIEGKIKAIEFLRKNKIPFLGLCLGMQLAVVEFARNVCGMKDANSAEFDKNTKHPVIDVMPDQKVLLEEKMYGGTMRLGAYKCKLEPDTLSFEAYGKKKEVLERHRHRYEFNNDFRQQLTEKGLVIAGVNPERELVEIVELKDHPFFVGSQFHPEFTSTPLSPNPLFRAFIKSSIKK